jgi:CDP-glucose 4,6-dehydratase
MPHPFSSFYRGKRVLVTGHTGFAGGWTVAWLKHLEAQVYGYGLPPASRPNFFDATLLDRGMTSIFGDVRDRKSLVTVFSEFQPEIVIHCASRSNPQLAQHEPVETFSTNVMGTVFILEEARLSDSVRAVVQVNSAADCNATNGEEVNIHEASMACSNLASTAFTNSFLHATKTGVATARLADVIGGGDWRSSRVVPNLVRSLMYGEPVEVDGQQLRIWHVLEAAHASLSLAHKLFECGQRYSGTWDFGPAASFQVSASEFADNFVKLWDAAEPGRSAEKEDLPVHENGAAQHGPEEFSTLSAEQATAWTVEWFRAFYADAAGVWRVTEDQIERYMQMAAQPDLVPQR